MSLFDWSFLDPIWLRVHHRHRDGDQPLGDHVPSVPFGRAGRDTHQAGLNSSIARLALAQRIALAALAIFLMLNAVTPFITPDPPWLANLPLVIAIMAFLLAFGLSHMRADSARAAEAANSKNRKRLHNGWQRPASRG